VRSRKVFAVALVVGLVAVGCTDGDDRKATPTSVPTTVSLVQFGAAEIVSPVAARRALDAATAKAVMAVTQRFFDAAVTGPLRTGKRGTIKAFFTAEAAKDALGADRAALFDTGLPRVRSLKSSSHVVQLTGYAMEDNRVAVVVAKFAWDIAGDGARVRVVHRGELTLEPASGAWVVSGYDVTTTRKVGSTTTTSRAERS
jgi:hypothetical protein